MITHPIYTNISENIDLDYIQEKVIKAESFDNKECKDKLFNSICYAKRIQDALLPKQMILQATFKESFISYRPKDTVSGDFYWFTKQGDKYIIAVSDCTGHGVPGAMISMLGFTMLDDIVKSAGISDPSRILNRLDKAVRKLFNQGKDGFGINDGMDMAICTIDFTNKQLQFAGASRPLYHFSNNVLNMYKGHKNTIGGTLIHNNSHFHTILIPYQVGDSIYLFSDGYADQFGGPKNKKFMSKNFIKDIESIQHLSMQEQEQYIVKKHLDWKGDIEQTDDILVMGLKLV